jgi:ribosomal protein L40E
MLDKYLSHYARGKWDCLFRCLNCGKNTEFKEIYEDEFGTQICLKCNSSMGFKEVVFGTPPAHKVAEWERNRALNPYSMPAWKVAKLGQIKELSKQLLASAATTTEELQAVSKAACGLSRFEHLQYCTDVMLDGLIARLSSYMESGPEETQGDACKFCGGEMTQRAPNCWRCTNEYWHHRWEHQGLIFWRNWNQ